MAKVRVSFGDKFEKLVVTDPAIDGERLRVLCLCECGNKLETNLYNLVYGKVKSCGCSRRKPRTVLVCQLCAGALPEGRLAECVRRLRELPYYLKQQPNPNKQGQSCA